MQYEGKNNYSTYPDLKFRDIESRMYVTIPVRRKMSKIHNEKQCRNTGYRINNWTEKILFLVI